MVVKVGSLAVLGFGLLCLLAPSRPANACSCLTTPSETYPARGATVPRNVKFWLPLAVVLRNVTSLEGRESDLSIAGYDGRAPALGADDVIAAHQLIGPRARSIPFTASVLAIGRSLRPGYFVVTPSRLLEPGPYTLRGLATGPGSFELSVVVENREQTTRPALPRVTVGPFATGTGRDACDLGSYFPFDSRHDGIITAMALTEAERTVPDRNAWVSDIFDFHAGIVGSTSCRENWDFARGPIFASFGVYDVAGNFSGWTRAFRLEAPATDEFTLPRQSAHGCACTTHPRRSAGNPAALLLLFLLWARRQRAPGPSPSPTPR
jgi:MYXO-CTERM domain-containing protein